MNLKDNMTVSQAMSILCYARKHGIGTNGLTEEFLEAARERADEHALMAIEHLQRVQGLKP